MLSSPHFYMAARATTPARSGVFYTALAVLGFAVSVSLTSPVKAASFAAQETRFIQHCTATSGDPAEMCQCAFDQWKAGIDPSQEAAAVAALDIMVTERDPTMDEMFVVQGPMMAYSQALMTCVMGGVATQSTPPAAPGTDMEAMMSGDTENILANLMALDAASNQAREDKRQQDKARRAQQDKQMATNRDQWKSEISAAQSRIGQPLKTPVSQFKELHALRCAGPDNSRSQQYCACEWNAITAYQPSVNERVNRAIAYIIVDKYDGDLPFDMSSTERSDVYQGIGALNQSIDNSCN